MTIIYFILILGLIIMIHEFGHFICAKKAKIHVYEFSLGMGPRLFKWNRKNDETDYSIRLFPIGGYVSMAGEEVEVDEKVPVEKRLQSKTWLQRFSVVVAGVVMNFILALVLLFIYGLIEGIDTNEAIMGTIKDNSPLYNIGIEENDRIIKINDNNTKSLDMFQLEYSIALTGKEVKFTVEKPNGEIKDYVVKPLEIKQTKKGKEEITYSFEFSLNRKKETGILNHIKYAFIRFFSLMKQMFFTIIYLITGKLSLKNLAGPIGIYSIVGQAAKLGFIKLVYLTALLSLNVGFINILPLPAFDGGRLFFMIIEKIIRKPVKPEIENKIHSIGLILLLILMVVICFNDIMRLF